MPGDRPIALDAYETLAHTYAALAESKAENGYNEHPAIREVIGPVEGLRVLEAGCGPGFLVRDLLAAGAARVLGFDVSPSVIEIARARVGGAAELRVADMAQPLEFVSTTGFDLVVSSLAIDYVRDWSVPLGEFRRALTSGGRLVFTVQHPFGSYRWFRPPTAFGVHYCEALWKGFLSKPVVVPDYYRSFEEIINPVLAAGFNLIGLHETRPIRALEEIDPEKYRRGVSFPTFMVVDAVTR